MNNKNSSKWCLGRLAKPYFVLQKYDIINQLTNVIVKTKKFSNDFHDFQLYLQNELEKVSILISHDIFCDVCTA